MNNSRAVIFKEVTIDNSTTQIEGIRDAFTNEPLDNTSQLFQCSNCKVYYSNDTYKFIRKENFGRCVSCLGDSIAAVSKTAKITFHGSYSPNVVTLSDYKKSLGHVVTFQGTVVRIYESRTGQDIALMFEGKSWVRGFKLVVFSRYIRAAGGRPFLNSLAGKTIKVRGLVVKHDVFGYEIILTGKSMITEIV